MLKQTLHNSRKNGFDVLAQEYVNEEKTSVETGYNDWSSSYTKIGQLVIDSTSLNEQSEDFCRSITFNPWNTAPEYQPIGGVQRLRKTIYTGIQGLRREYQTTLHKAIVDIHSQNQEVSLDQVNQAYPVGQSREAEIDEAEFDEYNPLEEMTQSSFDHSEINEEAGFDESVEVQVHVN